MRVMDPQEYQRRAEACLQRVARWLEGLDPDEVDYSVADGKVTFEFPDGMRFVLNRQGAASQMWFAAVARAWHYDWDPQHETWVDDRDGHDLYVNLADAVSRKLAHPVAAP